MKTTASMAVNREINETEIEISLALSGDFVKRFAGDRETPPEDATVDDVIATDEATGEEVTLSDDEHARAVELLMDSVE